MKFYSAGGGAASTASGGTIGGPVSGGTANSVLFVDAAGHLAQDNANLSYSAGNLHVGGTLSAGTVSATGNVSGVNVTGSGTVQGASVTSTGLLTAGNVNVTAGGKIGIATGTPGDSLEVSGAAGNIAISNVGGAAYSAGAFYSYGVGNAAAANYERVVIGFAGSNVVNFVEQTLGTGVARDMQIKAGSAFIYMKPSTGNVGIGSSSPSTKLHVAGIPVFANNAAAITGGLTAGGFYRTGADPDTVCVVH